MAGRHISLSSAITPSHFYSKLKTCQLFKYTLPPHCILLTPTKLHSQSEVPFQHSIILIFFVYFLFGSTLYTKLTTRYCLSMYITHFILNSILSYLSDSLQYIQVNNLPDISQVGGMTLPCSLKHLPIRIYQLHSIVFFWVM